MKTVRVFASATVANVACGFDSLGFAIREPGDEVVLRTGKKPGLHIHLITGDGGKLPRDPQKNTAGVAVQAFLNDLGEPEAPLECEIHKKMPLGSGLGSSAASAAAAVVAANAYFGNPYERNALLPYAMLAEKMACGTAHADNVAPALLGGFILIRSYHPLDVIPLHYPKDLWCSVLHPHIELLTSDARRILKRQIRLDDAVVQWSNLAGLITGLQTEVYELIGRSLNDIIFEPVRSLLIPGFDAVKGAALQGGALGCSISGSGPSMFALSRGEAAARDVARAMQAAITPYKLGSDVYVSPINAEGPLVFA